MDTLWVMFEALKNALAAQLTLCIRPADRKTWQTYTLGVRQLIVATYFLTAARAVGALSFAGCLCLLYLRLDRQ